MIRKNDSQSYIGKWNKTIVPKINWHISINAVYNYRATEKGREKKMIKNTKRLNRSNWGNRMIGVHYTDHTSRYKKRLVSEYDALKELQYQLKKRGIGSVFWSFPRLNLDSADDIKNNYKLIKNVLNKYGFEPVINWEYIGHFAHIHAERVRDVYTYPFL